MPHGWLGERLMAAASVLIVGWSVLVGCSGIGGRPTDPGSGCFPGASTLTCNVVRVTVTHDGAFSLVINGGILSGADPGGRSVSTSRDEYGVPLGTNLITGTTSASTLTIALSSVPSATGGVVQRGSLTNDAGPGGVVAACSATYTIPSGGARPQAFRARYTVYAGPDQC